MGGERGCVLLDLFHLKTQHSVLQGKQDPRISGVHHDSDPPNF